MDLAVIWGNPMAASGTSSWYMKIIAIGGGPNGLRTKNAHYIFDIEMGRIWKSRKMRGYENPMNSTFNITPLFYSNLEQKNTNDSHAKYKQNIQTYGGSSSSLAPATCASTTALVESGQRDNDEGEGQREVLEGEEDAPESTCATPIKS